MARVQSKNLCFEATVDKFICVIRPHIHVYEIPALLNICRKILFCDRILAILIKSLLLGGKGGPKRQVLLCMIQDELRIENSIRLCI